MVLLQGETWNLDLNMYLGWKLHLPNSRYWKFQMADFQNPKEHSEFWMFNVPTNGCAGKLQEQHSC